MIRVECKQPGCKNLTQPGKFCRVHSGIVLPAGVVADIKVNPPKKDRNVPVDEPSKTLSLWNTTLEIILKAYPDKDMAWAKRELMRAARNAGKGVKLTDLLKFEFNIELEVEKP